MKEVFLLLGSNRGNRTDFISRALKMIDEKAGAILNRSGVYETEPWGFEDSVPFLNQVVEIDTNLSPAELLEQMLTIETQLGRIRPFDSCGGSETGGYTGRTIDLDILFYGQKLIFTESLMVPHPRLHERRFTLVPLHEIAPGFIHPLLKKTISVILQNCTDNSKVTKIEEDRK